MTIMKLVVWLALTAALLAVKLWPIAFMVLLAAGGVTAIEAWRGRAGPVETNEAPPASPPARRMSEEEALSVLGLKSGASAEEVRSAYRKLIAQLHPDKGGTDYLAAKINEARDLLLRSLDG
ncbi:DnaJ domain-containing protein [Hyphococcus sp.]|uniref:DnaJ domain-containing protein n=1 Tax=Hyphococcus sp. TaxID=2038636 RepID=UPI0035C77B8C